MTADAPDPARLAAVDQQLAEMSDRLDRNARTIMRGDIALSAIAVALIVAILAGHPRVYSWELVIALAAVAIGAAASYMQGLMLRNYRAEIRDLRARTR